MFRPIVKPDLLVVSGINLFFRSRENEDDRTNGLQRVRWTQKPPFPVFSTFSPHGGRVDIPSDELISSVTVGSPNLVVDSLVTGDAVNYVVTAPQDSIEFNRASVQSFFTQCYGTLTDFWEEEQPQPFTLVLVPFEKMTTGQGGFGIHNGFFGRFALDEGPVIMTRGRKELYAHEIGHHWIGADMKNQWFGEGFNEYQTALTIVKSGLLPPQAYVDYLNNALGRLWRSDVRNITNEEIVRHFWDLGDYLYIPYWRGNLYAFRLMGQIEASTGSPHPFKDLMMELKGETSNMTPEKFFDGAGKFLERDLLENEFDRYIVHGETIDFTDVPILSGLELKYREDGTPFLEICDQQAFLKHFD